MKILVCCANGAGTSMLMMKTAEKVVESLGLEVEELNHSSMSAGNNMASRYDVVFCPQNLIKMLRDVDEAETKVIGLNNVLSQTEMEEKLKASGVI